ncbi:hypothetical protein J41TS12_46930 [Paenibacillus antibioticophila]|uniref:FMN-binding domain-containing protein n=1 Tax=Paenibacillus antibioticophila TaxID=1274374 RepID=A0A919Y095_9BACL|nr:FMN-binding protein [Paenibacillus antibioticophila]GIO39832.1 hypothetical protein J41TS12_46930 [Paenibacillus antibioticophila]
MKKAILVSTVVLLMAALTACGGNKANNNAADGAGNGANRPAATETTAGTYVDGSYKVEADAFDSHGWKPFIELVIKDHKIDSVNFDYVNEEGAMKTESAEYKAAMEPQSGTYPEKYTAELEQQLIDKQSISDVDVITGATTSSNNFHALVKVALDDLAVTGETSTKAITIEE